MNDLVRMDVVSSFLKKKKIDICMYVELLKLIFNEAQLMKNKNFLH